MAVYSINSKGIEEMQSVATNADTAVSRPTQLIAEALLDQHNPTELISRAQRLGFSHDLTEAVVTVCCRDRDGQKTTDCHTRTPQS
jgi:uncharacterized protein YjhX (UPF0386 family)